VQGVLITPVARASSRLARLQRRGTCVVLVDSRSPSRGQCSVAVDDVLGGDRAVSHLLAAGHERIAYVSGPPAIRQVADRLEAALRAFARAGRPAEDLRVTDAGALNVAAGQKAARRGISGPSGQGTSSLAGGWCYRRVSQAATSATTAGSTCWAGSYSAGEEGPSPEKNK
jgi:LacI family transcriptional regulator